MAGGAAELAESFERIAFASPEAAARTILPGNERDRPRIIVGADARALGLIRRVLGSAAAAALGRGGRPGITR